MESSCIHKFGSTNTWIAHMDVDEFLLPNATNPANLDGSGEASLVPLIMARNDSEVGDGETPLHLSPRRRALGAD
jgi:hypothetical protein